MTLRSIGGFTAQEVADRLEITLREVEGEYRLAHGSLRKRIEGMA